MVAAMMLTAIKRLLRGGLGKLRNHQVF